MLGSQDIVGFIPTRDFKNARAFYESVLGLEFESADPFALVFRSNGRAIRIAKVDDFTPFPFTLLGWEVQDVEKVATGLKERGVTFEKFPGMGQTELGIWKAPSGARIGWFKDPDGNLLSISQYSV